MRDDETPSPRASRAGSSPRRESARWTSCSGSSPRDSGNPVESPLAKVLRDGRIVALANHTVLLSRDGRVITDRRQRGPHPRTPQGKSLSVPCWFSAISPRAAGPSGEQALALEREKAARRGVRRPPTRQGRFLADALPRAAHAPVPHLRLGPVPALGRPGQGGSSPRSGGDRAQRARPDPAHRGSPRLSGSSRELRVEPRPMDLVRRWTAGRWRPSGPPSTRRASTSPAPGPYGRPWPAIPTGCSRWSGTCCRTRSSSRPRRRVEVLLDATAQLQVAGSRTRAADRPRLPAACLRPISPGRGSSSRHARPRYRPGHRAPPGRAARGHGGAESEGDGRGATFTVRLPMAAPHSSGSRVTTQLGPRPGAPEADPLRPTCRGARPGQWTTTPMRGSSLRIDVRAGGGPGDRWRSARARRWRPWKPSKPGRARVRHRDAGRRRVRGLPAERQGRTSAAAELPGGGPHGVRAPGDRDRAIRAGFQLHVAKPIDPTALVRAVACVRPRQGHVIRNVSEWRGVRGTHDP